MNLASILLLLVILAALAYGIYKIKDSKGACDDCNVTTCPVHEQQTLPIYNQKTGPKV